MLSPAGAKHLGLNNAECRSRSFSRCAPSGWQWGGNAGRDPSPFRLRMTIKGSGECWPRFFPRWECYGIGHFVPSEWQARGL